MRVTALLFASVFFACAPAFAQDWDQFTFKDDGFKVDFPGTPKVTDTTWKSQMDYILPGKVYSVEKGKERYSVTVIDYRPIEQQGIERAKTCEEGNQQCRQNAGIMGPGYWKHDERGAVMYATFTSVGIVTFSFCSPSRGPTSTMRTVSTGIFMC